jgi:hypothetical protein
MLMMSLRRMFGARREVPASKFAPARSATPTRHFTGDPIFRMRSWPDLPVAGRTAEIYRMLSVMSSQPSSRRWLVERSGIAPRRLDRLLAQLVREGAVEVIDPASFLARDAATA